MASPAAWIPSGWEACKVDCTKRPLSKRLKHGIYELSCKMDDACLNEGRYGCRLISRKMIRRDSSEPDGWELGPAVMEEETCGEPVKKMTRKMYQCHYLVKITDDSKKKN